MGFILQFLRNFFHFVSGTGPCCRFDPVCSRYVEQAIRTHGIGRGGLLSARRVLRCHPWGEFGWDPVPPRPQLSRKGVS